MTRLERAWITWETQRRSLVLAKHFGCRLFLFEHEHVLRYPLAIVQTLFVMLVHRPKILFVQHPTMILAAIACTVGKLFSNHVVVDRHTTFRLNKPHHGSPRIWLFMRLHYLTLRNAHTTIITNTYLADIVTRCGGSPFILPDFLLRERRAT